MFRCYSLVLPFCRPLPPLLYRHDPKQVAGRIDEMSHDSDGNLRIRATVTHEQAKRCPAFSVAAKVTAYELRDEDSPNFYAVITAAEITEVSLTPTPANPNALVLNRYPQFASVALHDHAIAGFRKGMEILGCCSSSSTQRRRRKHWLRLGSRRGLRLRRGCKHRRGHHCAHRRRRQRSCTGRHVPEPGTGDEPR